MKHILYFDVETQHSAEQVGGWDKIADMKLSVAITYHSVDKKMYTFAEYGSKYQSQSEMFPKDVGSVLDLIKQIEAADLVVGHNTERFDFVVLSRYLESYQQLVNGAFTFDSVPSFDMMVHLKHQLGFRVSLGKLAAGTFDDAKGGDGLDAIKWWEQGKCDKIIEYCKKDVELTRDIFHHGCEKGFLKYVDKYNKTHTIDTSMWKDEVKRILNTVRRTTVI